MDRVPRIGVGVIVIKDSRVLVGKRTEKLGRDLWSFAGGHLEFGESVEECAAREVLEETGMKIKNIRMGPFTNEIYGDIGKHYITLFVVADHAEGEPKVMDPKEVAEWSWCEWSKLPRPLFLPIENLLKLNYNPLSAKKISFI